MRIRRGARSSVPRCGSCSRGPLVIGKDMEFVVATSTITTFINTLFSGTLSFVFSIITIVWPYALTLMVIGLLLGLVIGLKNMAGRH